VSPAVSKMDDDAELTSLNDGTDDRFQTILRSEDQYEMDEKDVHEEDLEMEETYSEFAEGGYRAGPCEPFGIVCLCFKRVGNMHVIFETVKDGHRKLWLVVGPFWPCTAFITYPILGAVTFGLGWTFTLQHYPWPVLLVWYAVGVFCLVCLGMTSCSNPGILRRETRRRNSQWVWTKQTSSFRPPKATFCRDCNCVIEEYDHVCPWTGTAIGKKNMCCFQAFVSSCAIMFIFAIFIVVAGSLFVHKQHHEKH